MDLILMILLGMVVGSFITMASYRFAVSNKGVKDLLICPSSCTKCGHKLKIINLIPIFSWILQKGKCAFCSKEISIRYPLIEIISAVSFVVIYLFSGGMIDVKLLIYLLIFITLFIMVITDLEHYFISDINQIILFIIAVFYHITITFDGYFYSHFFFYYFYSAALYLIFGLVLRYIFLWLMKREGIGVDDIKFFVVAGFMLGINKFSIFIFLSGLFGIIFGLIWTKIKKENSFPFAPALIVSLLTSLLIY